MKFLRCGKLTHSLHIDSENQPTQGHVAMKWKQRDRCQLIERLGQGHMRQDLQMDGLWGEGEGGIWGVCVLFLG